MISINDKSDIDLGIVNNGDALEFITPRQFRFVPKDDMTPIEAVYICMAVQSVRFSGSLERSVDWDKIKRHFEEITA